MTYTEILDELKEYLKIPDDDVIDDDFLLGFVQTSVGYVISNYNYYMVDGTLTEIVPTTQAGQLKYYLPKGPAVSLGAVVVGDEVVTTTASLKRTFVKFDEPIASIDVDVEFTYDVGVLPSAVTDGDLQHTVALAAYFYRQADKGLEGVAQISTGVKESGRFFEGIPKYIKDYFQSRKFMRL